MLTSTPPNPTPVFGTRPSQVSISLSGGVNFTISNVYFNQPIGGPGAEYIELDNYTGNITITDCDFADYPVGLGAGRRCIYLFGCIGTVTIMRCRARNIPQNFIQFNQSHLGGIIADNKVRGTTANSEDCISMFRSGGSDAAHRLVIYNNHIDGNIPSQSFPGYSSTSGSGILLGDSAQDSGTGYIDCRNNTLLNPGAVGIGVAGGTDISVTGNQMWSDQTFTSNVGMYTWNPGSSLICSVLQCWENRVKWTSCGGADNGYFNTGNCGTITLVGQNNFSDPTLNPAVLTVNLK